MDRRLTKLVLPVLSLSRATKRALVLSLDVGLCILATWLAFYLRLGTFVSLANTASFAVIASIGIAIPIFIKLGLYRAIFRYSGGPAMLSVTWALGIYGILYFSIFTALGLDGIPRTVGIIQPILLFLFISTSRGFARIWLGDEYAGHQKKEHIPKVLIYGAGSSGRRLVNSLAGNHEMLVVGFLDDDVSLRGGILNGRPVYDPADLEILVESLKVGTVLLAMPNLSRQRRAEILNLTRRARVAVRTLPDLSDLVNGKVSISDLQELDIYDLLGREPVPPNVNLLAAKVRGQVVMVTGAGGSIGGELCRQILAIGPSKILMIDNSEFALYRIHQELIEKAQSRRVSVLPLLASVQDKKRISEIMSTWKPAIVYHAAAYKHVPLVEYNFVEGVKNNVWGTLVAAEAAIENKIADFVLVSTDKAVRPTNAMGASKRLAELILQALSMTGVGTTFCMVRFGNVLGSSGSVVPKFRQQIRNGGPITLTHREITRFFMTIPEAAQLVIQSSTMAGGGDVFLLDMGTPVRIMDLACRMIELAGLTVKDTQRPDGDIEIITTGLRPGEKLYEELLIGDNAQPTAHDRIMKANEDFIPWVDLQEKLRLLETALDLNKFNLSRQIIKNLVSGYEPSDEIVDWMYREHRE